MNSNEAAGPATRIAYSTLQVIPVAVVAGSASAFFLKALERVTRWRFEYPWLLFLLPAVGALLVWVYKKWGDRSDVGNKLIVEEIHTPGGGVPTRMAPLVLAATLVTHLFGGSAGREGTAVQMGGSIAGGISRWFRTDAKRTKVLLMAGVAAGFGSVFGTPITGAVFAFEVLALGKIDYEAICPIVVSSVIADQVCSAWGIHHIAYSIAPLASSFGGLSLVLAHTVLVVKSALAGLLFGFASLLFIRLDHGVKSAAKRTIPIYWLRPVAGGIVVICLTWLVGTQDYLGLGVIPQYNSSVTLVSAFTPGGSTPWSWFWKILFTAITLGSGFKGGEVTPLFFIGATLGNALSGIFAVPVDLFAGLGLLAVFAAAANTPLACTIMGFELFGGQFGAEFAVACFAAYFVSAQKGLYHIESPIGRKHFGLFK